MATHERNISMAPQVRSREISPWPPKSVSHRMPLHSTSEVSLHKRGGPPVARGGSLIPRVRSYERWQLKEEAREGGTYKNTAYVPCQQVPLTINLPSMLYTLGNKSDGTRHAKLRLDVNIPSLCQLWSSTTTCRVMKELPATPCSRTEWTKTEKIHIYTTRDITKTCMYHLT